MRDRHFGKVDEVEQQDTDTLELLRCRRAEIAHFFIDGARHDVQKQLLDTLLFTLQFACIAFGHLRIGIEQILGFLLLTDVSTFNDNVDVVVLADPA